MKQKIYNALGLEFYVTLRMNHHADFWLESMSRCNASVTRSIVCDITVDYA